MLLIGGLVVLLGAALAGFVVTRRPADAVETVELRFPSDISEAMVSATLAGISGLSINAPVILEVVGDENGIRHFLRSEGASLEMLRSHLRGLLPGVRLEAVEEASGDWRVAARLRFSGPHPLLRDDQGSLAAASLLGALSALGKGERLMVRWSLWPAHGPQLPERPASSSATRLPAWAWPQHRLEAHHLRALRTKYGGPVIQANVVVAAGASSMGRSVNLALRVLAVLRARSGMRGVPVIRWCRSARRVERFIGRRPLFIRGSRFSPGELVGMVGWPIDGTQVPGLSLGVAPQLMPSPRLPRSGGRVLANANWPGMERRRLVQTIEGGLSHSVVVGPSGVGKSALMASVIRQDLVAGRGCLVIDGKGDLAGEVLRMVPDARLKDVVVLDPAREGAVPGLRVFGGSDPEQAGDLVLGMFRSIFRDSWGVRSDKWLRAGLVTLAHERSATLADLPFLFASDAYRRRLTGRLSDPLLKATWAEFEALSPEGRAQQLGSPLNKINEIVGRRLVRAVVAQTDPKWDMRAALRRGQVVIVSLSPGVIGGAASRLLAALVLGELFQAVQARASIPAGRRRPFFVYVDEPKVFADVNVPLDAAFELFRGLGVGMTISAQSITQLPGELARAVLTNAATLIAFRQNHDDARLLAKELPGVASEQLQALGQFEIAARIGLGPGDVTPPVTGRTLPPREAVSDPETVRGASASRYGRDPAEVDAALAERHGLSRETVTLADEDVPIGRRRRQTP